MTTPQTQPSSITLNVHEPFAPRAQLIEGSDPFVSVQLTGWPSNVQVFVRDPTDARALAGAFTEAARTLDQLRGTRDAEYAGHHRQDGERP